MFFFCFWLRFGICCLLQRINAERIMTPAASWRRLDLYSPSIKLPSFNDIHLGIISGSIFNSGHHKQWLSAQQLWFLMTPAVSREGAHSGASLKHHAFFFFCLNMMSEKKHVSFLFAFVLSSHYSTWFHPSTFNCSISNLALYYHVLKLVLISRLLGTCLFLIVVILYNWPADWQKMYLHI